MNMKLKSKVVILLFICISVLSQAQKKSNEENANYANQLKQKYSKSSAIILKVDKTFDFSIEKDQVKVMESSNEEIMSLRYNSDLRRSIFYDINSTISDNKVRSEKNKVLKIVPTCGNYQLDDVFYSDLMICVYPFSFINLGEIKKFEYIKTINDIRYLTSLYFNDNYPVKSCNYTFNVPSWLDVEFKEINCINFKIEKKITKDAKKGLTTYNFSVSDLDEFLQEPNSFEISHTYPHILVIAKSFVDKEGKKNNIIGNIKDLYGWCYQLASQLKNDNAVIKPTVDKLIANSKTDLDKIKSIYYWVQDNIRYIAFENGIAAYKPAEAADVFKKKYGDCKGMANLTKSMLKLAGFDARLAWIGTSSIPYDYSIPSLAINNHMICCVILNNKRYYLDATEKYIGLNDYAERIQGRTVMVEDSKNYILDTIPELNNERNLNITQFKLSMDNNNFTGKCIQNFRGESHQGILYYLNNNEKETQKKLTDYLVTKGDKNIIANGITSSDQNDKENPYNIEADVVINNKISHFDNDYYLDIDFYKDFSSKIFKDKRTSDINFDEKINRKTLISIAIPTNMKVKQMPTSLEISESSFHIMVNYSVKENIISYEKTISIPNGWIPKGEVDKWNNAIKTLSEKYNENIVLTQI